MKLAVVGANGQVGTELCFLLRGNADLIPIVRNKLGKIFLEHNGFKCRIADISREKDAEENLHDIDVVVITAYALDPLSGSQSQISKAINEKIIKNSIRFSNENSTIIYMSTIRAFAHKVDPTTSRFWPPRYDAEKQYLERVMLSECRKRRKRGFPLRIGHVYGENQGSVKNIKKILSNKKIVVQASPENKSNVVHTVTLKDAILKCIQPEVKPRVYSVVNNPQWTWKDVFEYYNKKTQIEFKSSTPMSKNSNDFLWKMIKANRKYIIPILEHLPRRFDKDILRKRSMKKMLLEISMLKNEEIISSGDFGYNPIPGLFLPGLTETRELLKNSSLEVFKIPSEDSIT